MFETGGAAGRLGPRGRGPGGPGGAGGAQAIPVTMAAATRRDLPLTLDTLGTVAAIASVTVRSQVSGQLMEVLFREGQEVKAGETLAVVEAMKMENVLRADRDLTVEKIVAEPGDSLAVDAVIMEFA